MIAVGRHEAKLAILAGRGIETPLERDWSPQPVNEPVAPLPWDKAEELYLAHWHRMTRLAGMEAAA